MRFIELFVIHCSATKETVRFTADDCKQFHLNKGWSDIGYHWYIEVTGQIIKGRADSVIGAHAKGHNRNSIAICYEGGLDSRGMPSDTRTSEQKKSMDALYKVYKKAYPAAEWVGHRDLSPDKNRDGKIDQTEWIKHCPCFDVKSEYA